MNLPTDKAELRKLAFRNAILPLPKKLEPATPSRLDIHFDHGLGDCVNFARLLQLYKVRGWDIGVVTPQRRQDVFRACGIRQAVMGTQHPWGYHDGFNKPSLENGRISNKIGANLNREPLPYLGPPDALWDELCGLDMSGAAEVLIDEATREKAAELKNNLAKPVILLHYRGVAWADQKDLPDATATELCRQLKNELGASIIVLDFARRPNDPSDAIKVLDVWNNTSLGGLAALMGIADLLIGIDSGPYHFASLCKVPVLGVFHKLYPSCGTLPNPRSLNMSAGSAELNKALFPRWRTITYSDDPTECGEMPTAGQIVKRARGMLDGLQD